MPATSKSQQRLMGMAYAYKMGMRSLDDLDPDLVDKIIKIADSMSLEDLKHFAKTKHDGLAESASRGFKMFYTTQKGCT